MIRAGSGLSENRSLEKGVFEATTQALDKIGVSKPDAMMIFAAGNETKRWTNVLKKIKTFTGLETIVGSSAFGVLTETAEIEQRSGIAVLALTGLGDSALPFLIPNLQENNFKAAACLAENLKNLLGHSSLAIILPDAFSFQHGPFFDGFEAENEFTPLAGGCASEPGGEEKTYQWLGDKLTFDAVAGLAFGDNLEFEIGISQSCQPLGEPLQITRSQGNVIFEIEGRPAYNIFLELITQLHFEDTREVFHRLFLGLPVTSFQTDFNRSRYLVRNIMGVNARKGVVACASHVEEGDYMTFTLRDPSRAKQDLILMLEDLRQKAGDRRAAFGLYFNCCARGSALYGTTGEDTTLIREFFPGLPVAGFFTFGEIAPLDETNHLHHYSGIFAIAFEK